MVAIRSDPQFESDPILDGEGVYLLHFDPPYAHAGHYLGWSNNLARRTAHHLNGSGNNPLANAALAAGYVVTVARTWVGADRTFERRLKGHGKARVCPMCLASTS